MKIGEGESGGLENSINNEWSNKGAVRIEGI